MSAGKFRISLNKAQIDWIIANCQADMPELYKQLSILKAKADLGFTQPAYELKEKIPKPVKPMSLEDRYQIACKQISLGQVPNPALQAAYDEYRYLNDLMTPEDAAAYELQI